MTIMEMCRDIAEELPKRGLAFRNTRTGQTATTAEEIYNYSPTGELLEVFAMYWSLFPERLPADVPDPALGALRFRPEYGRIEMWDGHDWH